MANKPLPSLHAFIEVTANWLRSISRKKSPSVQKRNKNSLSTGNKVEQIAKLLREKIHQRKRSKKQKKSRRH